MPAHTLIDLSHSTDDEGELLQSLPAPQTSKCAVPPEFTSLIDLRDEFGPSTPAGINSEERLKRSINSHKPTPFKLSGTGNYFTTIQQPLLETQSIPMANLKKPVLVGSDSIIFTSSPAQRPHAPRNLLSLSPLSSDSEDYTKYVVPRSPIQMKISKLSKSHNHKVAGIKRKRRSDDTTVRGDETMGLGRVGAKTAATVADTSKAVPMNNNVPEKSWSTGAKRNLREQEKEEARSRKGKEKEKEKERKRLAKENTAREKKIAADRAAVNKIKLDKRASVLQMIVDLPDSIAGSSVDIQIRETLKCRNVQTNTWKSPVPHVVQWRRKAVSYYDEEKERWEPMPVQVQVESLIVCLLSARDFVNIAIADPEDLDQDDLETHVLKMKSVFELSTIVYVIEGLNVLAKKSRNAQNRAFQAAVTAHMASTDTASGSTAIRRNIARRNKKADHPINEDAVEEALLQLQVLHGCMVHHTVASIDTAQWILFFTEQISQKPYWASQTNFDVAFCMDAGQVKSGLDREHTFVKMLGSIIRVTENVAYSIVAHYPTALSLVQCFRKHGPLALQDLRKTANKNGAMTNTRVGQAISRRIYKVFMENNPKIMDI